MIFQYTDEQAQEDGVLVKIGGPDRVSRNVFDLVSEQAKGNVAPYFTTWLSLYGKEARRIFDHNIGQGLWYGALLCAPVPVLRPMTGPVGQEVSVWIMPNEQGGLTLMLPEDY